MADFSIEAVRERFPALALTDQGRRRIYLDNPAGTQVPRAVADAVSRCLLTTNANLGGFFETAVAAQQHRLGWRVQVTNLPGTRLSLGRTALNPKASLGAKPEPMTVWMRHRQPVVNALIRNLLTGIEHEEPPERNPFKSTMNVADPTL